MHGGDGDDGQIQSPQEAVDQIDACVSIAAQQIDIMRPYGGGEGGEVATEIKNARLVRSDDAITNRVTRRKPALKHHLKRYSKTRHLNQSVRRIAQGRVRPVTHPDGLRRRIIFDVEMIELPVGKIFRSVSGARGGSGHCDDSTAAGFSQCCARRRRPQGMAAQTARTATFACVGCSIRQCSQPLVATFVQGRMFDQNPEQT